MPGFQAEYKGMNVVNAGSNKDFLAHVDYVVNLWCIIIASVFYVVAGIKVVIMVRELEILVLLRFEKFLRKKLQGTDKKCG